MYGPQDTTTPRPPQQHPRRPPAHKSVSLRHSPPAPSAASDARLQRHATVLSSPDSASDKANPPSSLSPKDISNKNSSGESSDVGRWFETTNNSVNQKNASFNDNDPPFFLRNSSSSETPPEAAQYAFSQSMMPYRPILGHGATEGSSTEDFRSVIDDLTVVNKKLKQKLKKYEKMYDEHLQEEKLFEVKFHGLPDHKKKELEETLRKFASTLDDGAAEYPPLTSYAPALGAHNTASSTSRFAESGYASMSASGRYSNTPSNQEKEQKETSKSVYKRQQQTIQSYLHDIPVGLLPQSNVSMTDKSKKKLVVRRLEQIFAGKQSVPGNHQQPMQQEEVAQSAAVADREQREATGKESKPEGLRTARIRPNRGDQVDQSGVEDDASGQVDAIQGLRPALHIGEQDFASPGLSPDQRPTRPLDLDPYRAQVPLENMTYIRHLGFTPPDMVSGEATALGHGWIYLNLLINMAQLHTLNVTPDFVKDALVEYSSHLEISHDGRKVRWKGGRSVTRHSGESSSEHYSTSPDELTGSGSSPKGVKPSASGAGSERQSDLNHHASRVLRAKRESERNRFAYKPLFFRKDDSEEEEDYFGMDVDSTNNSGFQQQQTRNSSGLGSSAVQSVSSKPRREDGPMIFYTKANFCTDLSGDRLGATLTHPGAYKAVTSHPIGLSPEMGKSTYESFDLSEPRGPLDATPMDVDSVQGSIAHTVSSGDDFGFSPEALKQDSGNDSPELMDFEVSGIGGVQPEDNFSIHVRRSQVPSAPPAFAGRRKTSLYPKKIANALATQESPRPNGSSPEASPPPFIKEELLSASRKSLPNSVLPPASFLPFDSTSSGDVDSDLESDASSSGESDTEECPAPTLQILNISPLGKDSSDEESDGESDYSDDSEDASVDLLATARQLDPKTILASEREYDAAVADRLAEEIPAGSSAATAGGGSGFNSPVNRKAMAAPSGEGSTRNNRQSSSGSLSSQTKKLKRALTSDSLVTSAKKKSQKVG